MSFADPQTLNSQTLARTGQGLTSGTFSSADGVHTETISHMYGKRSRRQLRYTHKKIVADPLVSGVNIPVSMSVYLVVDSPQQGYTVAEQKALCDAFVAYLAASTGARVGQLLGGES
ncbi:TPA_asm: coat protein [ssRNA phage Gephyllon.3_10]|uniref:Coat protein n=2 Tax=Leviviricetes TaxID=2842243 RepID=A0A8S5L371_9VIRU|nr:coat protein [ssRNA phage Gephyllon.3_10]QDH86668.1 MAG: hypothetical protein H3BulkLitter171236_000002 [Leviviridae sp.]DAD51789.1 TPA_asm: coat protein [ssRNA phage Gephyllon.3_10]